MSIGNCYGSGEATIWVRLDLRMGFKGEYIVVCLRNYDMYQYTLIEALLFSDGGLAVLSPHH